MKKILFAAVICSAALPAVSQELQIPSLADQWAQAQQINLENLQKEIKTNDYFAGTYVAIHFDGQDYSIDRRAETPKRNPGNPPPRLETLGSLLKGVSANSRGDIKIKVHREFYDDGTLKNEDWSIDVGGSWTVDTGGFDEATQKQHR